MTSPVDFISGPKHRVGAREASERHDRLLDAEARQLAIVAGQVHLGELLPGHDPRRDLGERDAGGLAHERHRAARTRVDLEHVDCLVLHGELHVHQPAHAEAQRECARVLADPLDRLRAQRVGRNRAGRVTRVDARLLDVLHDAADVDALAVTHRIHVDLDSTFEEAVEQHRVIR